jgi:NADH-quinone oxidoreductase subunit G
VIKLKVDDIDYIYQKKEKNTYTETVFQYCYNKGITIPCFCYHEKLSIAGNCRMCIVQINNGLGVSCAVNLVDAITIYTDNKRVREARESILEFLLINHPLDCPICDQASECDLQDISLIFGADRGRFYEQKKRAVDNFNQKGPLIKTVMTRCIHCTRCVRFANEISNFMLGVISRGLKMEIGTYINENENISLLDILSGNIIDLCPVGALTSMPYAFKVRNWELIYYTNVDFLDSLASSIRLHIYSNKIIRILPLLDESLNEEWITNKTRFSYDSLVLNRINYPKIKYINKLVVFSWDFLMNYILKWIKRKNSLVFGVLGPFVDIITTLSLKNFFNLIGISSIISFIKFKWIYDFKFYFLLNNILESIEILSFFLFINCDLRLESPLLNVRIKKNYNMNRNNELFFYSYGLSLVNMNYPIKNLGNSIIKFLIFLKGKNRIFSNYFFKSFFSLSYIKGLNIKLYNKPIFFLGQSILNREDSISFLFSFICFFKNKFNWSIFNLIINNLGLLSYNTIIYNNINIKKKKIFNGLLYNISNDILPFFFLDKFAFIIYQGFIKSNANLFFKADIILPSTAPYEMDNLFINLEGRYRFMKKHIKNFLAIYSDWEIVNFLKIYNKKKNILNFAFFFKSNYIFQFFFKIINYICNFFFTLEDFFINFFFFYGYKKKNIIFLQNNDLKFIKILDKFFNNKFFNTLFLRNINNYYANDFFLRNSKIMALSAIKTYIFF